MRGTQGGLSPPRSSQIHLHTAAAQWTKIAKGYKETSALQLVMLLQHRNSYHQDRTGHNACFPLT